MGPCRLSRNGQSGYKDSRIAARGFTQPTPTTSLSSADLEKAAKPNLFNTLTELPALQGSTGRTTNTYSTSSGIQGLSSLSLRGLGTLRTLPLLDSQRVVGANVTGVTDVSQFPQLLVKRVDVVTGGASASYGSDAVGGVVNFITDKKFTGFKDNVEGGMTQYHDDKSGTLQAAWGKGFMDDRLHVVNREAASCLSIFLMLFMPPVLTSSIRGTHGPIHGPVRAHRRAGLCNARGRPGMAGAAGEPERGAGHARHPPARHRHAARPADLQRGRAHDARARPGIHPALPVHRSARGHGLGARLPGLDPLP
jgi:hypothetical protein